MIKTPTTIIIPPTTITNPPTTVTIPPTTITIPPTTATVPPTTITNPPTTVTIPPTTIITPPTTVITPPTTYEKEIPTTQIPETEYINKCKNEKCLKCNAESDKLELCISCDETKYKKVNYTNAYSKYYNCLEEAKLEKFYYDNKTDQYRPCSQYCKKCSGPGNATVHNCLECIDNYMLRPGPNPTNNCVVYSQYYYLSAYNEYKPLDSPLCPEEAKYTIIYENNKTSCIFDCRVDIEYKYLYNGYCLKQCPNGTNGTNFICIENDPNQVYISNNVIYLDINKTIEIIEGLAKTYAIEFNYTENHISTYTTEEFSILLYKKPGIIGSTNLKATDIDFGLCYEEVQRAYNITKNLITAVIEENDSNNPSKFYLFFHPDTGTRLEVGEICENKTIEMKVPILDESSENYELKAALTSQGINIYDINDPYYKDICYDFDNPKNRDMALKDRIKETYVDVELCDDGCVNTGIDLTNNVATCDCTFNEVTNNDIIHENAALEYLVGEIFDLVNSSNILVLKCYKYLLKYFTRSIGGIIIVVVLALCLIFTGIFFSFELTKMKRYIFTLTEKYTSFLANYSNIFKFFPPKRESLANKIKKDKDNKRSKNKNSSTSRTINPNSQSRSMQNSKDIIRVSSKKVSLMPTKEKPKEGINSNFLEDGKKIKKFFKEYLETSPDEMEFDDAIKRDKRKFCEYFCDIIKERQSLAYTFIASDPINTRMIKLILFSLNIVLYFVVNGLFFSESFISELYNINEEDETFFSFIPRTIDKIMYTAMVSLFIGYLTGFFFLEEQKVKGIFKRDKNNRMILKRSIAMLIREIQKRYISFIIRLSQKNIFIKKNSSNFFLNFI